MTKKPVDPKETYVVREVFCCGVGHCPGVTFTHWESGEACIMGGHEGCTNEEDHFYWRLALVPKYKGHPDKSKDQYSPLNGDLWEHLNLPENVNKWCQFPLAPEGSKEGQEVRGADLVK